MANQGQGQSQSQSQIKGLKKQRGVTLGGAVILFLLIGYFAYILFRVAPAYIENYSIKRTLNGLQEKNLVKRADSPGAQQQALIVSIGKSFRVSNVSVPLSKVAITPVGQDIQVRVKYDVREKYIYNVDFIISFDESVRIKAK